MMRYSAETVYKGLYLTLTGYEIALYGLFNIEISDTVIVQPLIELTVANFVLGACWMKH